MIRGKALLRVIYSAFFIPLWNHLEEYIYSKVLPLFSATCRGELGAGKSLWTFREVVNNVAEHKNDTNPVTLLEIWPPLICYPAHTKMSFKKNMAVL